MKKIHSDNPIKILAGDRRGFHPSFKRSTARGLGRIVLFFVILTTGSFSLQLLHGTGFDPVFQMPAAAAAEKAVKITDNSGPSAGDTFTNRFGMTFVYIAPGTFIMGSPESEKDREAHEQYHQVTLKNGFWLQTTEVTQAQWKTLMKDNPSLSPDCDDCPVDQVTYERIKIFLKALNLAENKDYRLPTEAEWEYAARAGTKSAYSFGKTSDALEKYGWYAKNSGDKSHPVAQKQPNPWGLYDMHGNVFEFVADYYADLPDTAVTDPIGPPMGTYHTIRSCGWDFQAGNCRSANRGKVFRGLSYFSLGFRVAAEPW